MFELNEVNVNDLNVLTEKGGEIRIGISPKKTHSEHMIMGRVDIAPGETVKEHVHDYGEESMYIVSGTSQLKIGDEVFELKKDHFYFVPKGIKHSIQNNSSSNLIAIFGTSPLAPNCRKGDRCVSKSSIKPVLGMNILKNKRPEILESFRDLTNSIDKNSSMTLKMKELILIGIFVANASGRGLDTHIHIAMQEGASEDEVYSAIIYALPICGITAVTLALEIAQSAIEDFKQGILNENN